MNCPVCRNVVGQPIVMAPLYIRNHPSRMNKDHDPYYSIVGYMCPLCEQIKRSFNKQTKRI